MVEQEFALPKQSIRSRHRSMAYRQARGLVFLLIREHLSLSYFTIGQIYNRDYATVYGAIQTAHRHIGGNDFYGKRYLSLKNRLRGF